MRLEKPSPGLTRPKFRRNFGGFTIIELLTATSLFSLVLLVALASFLRVSQLFYKGLIIDRSRQASQTILDSMRGDFNANSTITIGESYFCIGNIRYSYSFFNEVDTSKESSTNYGLVKDVLPGGAGCKDPVSQPFSNPQELLGNKMRLSQLTIVRALPAKAGNVYALTLKIAYGDDGALTNPKTPAATCVGNLSITEFCTTNTLFSAVSLGQ